MKHLAITLIFILSVTIGYAQESNQKTNLTKKELRAQRKAEQAKKDSIYRYSAMNALKSANWIFKATAITVSGSGTGYVAANVNYLLIEDGMFTFQTSTGFGGGPNNMGGITTKGLVKDMESSVDKRGNITYTFKLLGTMFNATVTLNMQHDGNGGELFMNFDRGMGSIIMIGSVYPIGTTKIYEGGYN